MSGLTENILRNQYTIFISRKGKDKTLRGTYLKRFADGIHPYELPIEEMSIISHLPNIMEILGNGSIIQINQSGNVVCGIIGTEKEEGPYGETKCFEVISQKSNSDYYSVLIDLDSELKNARSNKSEGVIQYTKLNKGVDRYE